jgi:hypothetical protein
MVDLLGKLTWKITQKRGNISLMIYIFAWLIILVPQYAFSQGVIVNLLQPENPVARTSLVIRAPVRSLQDITRAVLFYRDPSTMNTEKQRWHLMETP